MSLTDGQRTFAYFASFLGVVQGVTWLILSLVCVILYEVGITLTTPANYLEAYGILLYTYLLNKELPSTISNGVVTPNTFTIFMWIYIVLDVVWIGGSVILALAIKDSDSHRVSRASKMWIVITCGISTIDLILVIMLGAAFDACMVDKSHGIPSPITVGNEMLCYNIWLPVITVGARGYILWIINLIFAYFLYENQKSAVKRASTAGTPIPTIPRPNPQSVLGNPTYWSGLSDTRPPSQGRKSVNQNETPWTDDMDDWLPNVTNTTPHLTPMQSPMYARLPNQFRFVY